MKNFPVFIFPVSLEFYVGARHTHKQLLTMYNPYDIAVNFKVLCTSPNKFTVIDPEGVIAPQSCIDIVVRYTTPSASHSNTNEKFRITMYDRNTQQALGKRDVIAQLIDGEPSNLYMEGVTLDNFHPITKVIPQKPEEDSARPPVCYHPTRYREQQPVNVVAVAVSICCIAVLLLPTQPEPAVDTQWPEWLHIGANLKLVFSFVLGLVSMLVLRP